MALDFIAGCIGGCAGILVGHPLDTVKTRLQTQDFRNPQYKGTFDCFKCIIKQESVSGLYKGMSSPLAGIAVINALVFGVYGNLMKILPDPNALSSHCVAGAVAGLVQSFICSPLELAKTQIQVQKNKIFTSPLNCISHIGKTEGVRGVFRGLNMTLLREGIGFGVYFPVYEYLTKNDGAKPVSTPLMLAAGGCSGAACWILSYPFDIIKSRIQADGMNGPRIYKNSYDCLIKGIKSEGVLFLFRGLTPCLIRAFPTNATTWFVYSWVMEMYKEKKRTRKLEEVSERKFKIDDYKVLHAFATNEYLQMNTNSFIHSHLKYIAKDS